MDTSLSTAKEESKASFTLSSKQQQPGRKKLQREKLDQQTVNLWSPLSLFYQFIYSMTAARPCFLNSGSLHAVY